MANTAVVYSREQQGRVLRFEASGGLIDASLIMQDKETNTYWSVMKGEAVAGELEGNPLVELPFASKLQWKDWEKRHPETLVLSVNGLEDQPGNPYDRYLASDRGYRDQEATDQRLETKEEIFAFTLAGKKYAVPFRVSEGGAVFRLDGFYLFLFRSSPSQLFASTVAFRSAEGGFDFGDGKWVHESSGSVFDPKSGRFDGRPVESLNRMTGFDTFWYTWVALNPGTTVLSNPWTAHP